MRKLNGRGPREACFVGREDGHIVVETVGTFVPLVLLVVSILSLVNIIAVQARVHYALTQAANTLSMYCYTLEVTGMADELIGISEEAARVRKEAGAMLREINSVRNGIGSMLNLSNAADDDGDEEDLSPHLTEEAAGNPQEILELLLSYGIDEMRNMLFGAVARPVVGRYLANGDMSGDEYLRRAGVVNSRTGSRGLDALEFFRFDVAGMIDGGLFDGSGKSILLDENGNVKIVAEYEIAYTFGALPIPFGPTLRITQTVITKGWLSGSGAGYPKIES